MVVTAVVTYGILTFERSGFRPIERIIGSLVGIIGLCYLIEVFIAPVDWSAAALHTVLPQLVDGDALLLAVGIIGATVMPHAIYLHSSLTQTRTPVYDDNERRKVLRFSNQEVVVALVVAGLAGHRCGRCVPGLPYCIGDFELGRGNNGRPNHHARIHQVSDPDPGSATGNDDTGFRCRRSWRECDKCAGRQSGCAQYRPATPDDRAPDVHAKPPAMQPA
jgi:Natural resistance-associated macrophage protein